MTQHRRVSANLVVAVLFALLCSLAAPAVAAAAPRQPNAPGAPTGWVRLGHLSPKTPPVDIYLSPFGQPQRVAFREAAYGAVTPYSALAPGTYTVSMRPANAPASFPPALSANVDVKADTANTMLVFENGPNGTIRGQLLTDDLAAPAGGSGKVRVVQGAPESTTMDVAAVNGPTLATGLRYGDTGDYVTVPGGHWNVALKYGDTSAPATLDVRAATVCTVVVLNKPGGGLSLSELPDGTGTTSAPVGGAETGAGGTAPDPAGVGLGANGPTVAAVLLVGLVIGALTVGARRSRPRRRARG
ncbi:MAG TPA: DUF4397 domain-containing protein [Pseudonocardia sp.]|nr:DUF4397 domain-containing protein [Pseudonocardia sp.]